MALSPVTVLTVLIAILIFEFALTTVAELLQLRHQPSEPPDEVAGHVDADRYRRAQAYAAARTRLSRTREAFIVAVWVALLTSGALGNGVEVVSDRLGDGLLGSVVFLAGLALLFDLLTLPFAIWGTFGIEARFGFNRTTVATFVRDKFVGYAVGLVLGGGLVVLLLASYQWWGRTFWIPYAALVAVVVAFLAAFQTTLLLPLFNKLTPLEAGELRDAIERYVAETGYRLGDVHVMDASKRSSKSNAFFSGLGPVKKVVLFDTLIERHPVDEIVAVVAHEVGHQKRNHIAKGLVTTVAALTFMLFLASRVVDSNVISQALGAEAAAPALNLIAFVLLFGPVNLVVGVLFNALSRRFEYQADAFAARSHSRVAMMDALRRLVADSLGLTTAHPLYATLRLTHPAPVDRIRALKAGR